MDTHYWTQIRASVEMKSIKTIFTSGSNLKSLLSGNKTKLLPSSYPGVYELKCTWNSNYFWETEKKVLARTIEHQQDNLRENGTILAQQKIL